MMQSKEDILKELEAINQELIEGFAQLGPTELCQRPPVKEKVVWSAADHLRHLIRSVKPLALAFGLPKVALKLRFGSRKPPSQSFEDLKQIYLAALDKGLQAGDYAPSIKALDATEAYKQVLLQRWEKVGQSLHKNVSLWQEKALDHYQLPHPALGNLSMREMLFFTLYHNTHHLKIVQRQHGLPVSERFALAP